MGQSVVLLLRHSNLIHILPLFQTVMKMTDINYSHESPSTVPGWKPPGKTTDSDVVIGNIGVGEGTKKIAGKMERLVGDNDSAMQQETKTSAEQAEGR